jgi:hypothetical protein
MVTIRLAVGLRHHADGKELVQVEAGGFDAVVKRLRIAHDEMGMVLVNNRPVASRERHDLYLEDDDIVDIYPIFGGG